MPFSVEDFQDLLRLLDLPDEARVRRKGGAVDVVVWQTGTHRLLPRLLKGRTRGPVFVIERRARVPLPETGRNRGNFRSPTTAPSTPSAGG